MQSILFVRFGALSPQQQNKLDQEKREKTVAKLRQDFNSDPSSAAYALRSLRTMARAEFDSIELSKETLAQFVKQGLKNDTLPCDWKDLGRTFPEPCKAFNEFMAPRLGDKNDQTYFSTLLKKLPTTYTSRSSNGQDGSSYMPEDPYRMVNALVLMLDYALQNPQAKHLPSNFIDSILGALEDLPKNVQEIKHTKHSYSQTHSSTWYDKEFPEYEHSGSSTETHNLKDEISKVIYRSLKMMKSPMPDRAFQAFKNYK